MRLDIELDRKVAGIMVAIDDQVFICDPINCQFDRKLLFWNLNDLQMCLRSHRLANFKGDYKGKLCIHELASRLCGGQVSCTISLA